MEKDQNFKEAAVNYEQAWKYGNKNNPNIGKIALFGITIYFLPENMWRLVIVMVIVVVGAVIAVVVGGRHRIFDWRGHLAPHQM